MIFFLLHTLWINVKKSFEKIFNSTFHYCSSNVKVLKKYFKNLCLNESCEILCNIVYFLSVVPLINLNKYLIKK